MLFIKVHIIKFTPFYIIFRHFYQIQNFLEPHLKRSQEDSKVFKILNFRLGSWPPPHLRLQSKNLKSQDETYRTHLQPAECYRSLGVRDSGAAHEAHNGVTGVGVAAAQKIRTFVAAVRAVNVAVQLLDTSDRAPFPAGALLGVSGICELTFRWWQHFFASMCLFQSCKRSYCKLLWLVELKTLRKTGCKVKKKFNFICHVDLVASDACVSRIPTVSILSESIWCLSYVLFVSSSQSRLLALLFWRFTLRKNAFFRAVCFPEAVHGSMCW